MNYAWTPSAAFKRDANYTRFIAFCGLPDYETLLARSSGDPEWFWDALIRFFDLRFTRPYDKVLDLARGIERPRWCAGGRMNLGWQCLERNLERGRGGHTAIVWEAEDGARREWTYAELLHESGRMAAALAGLGVRRGDVVALYMPMLPETMAAFLAIVRMGAIAMPLFSGFGTAAIATRLADSGAVAAVIVDGGPRRGKTVAMKPVFDAALQSNTALRHVVVVARAGLDLVDVEMQAGRDHWWHELAARTQDAAPVADTDAEDLMLLAYTSGTTGRPKGTVHTHVGFGAQTAQDYHLGFDMKPDDRVLWMTDMGWLVGPVQIVAAALAGATLILVEGAPDYPRTDRLWRLVEEQRVSFLGIGPTLARSLRRYGDEVPARFELGSLRVGASTGEPWDADTWMWVYTQVFGARAPLMNYSGGTEMNGIISTSPLHPIKPASFHGPIPGTGADIVDAKGCSVAAGEVGELVMREPCIGLTRGLWRDEARFLDSYWRTLPGLWVHGDFASRDADGAWYIHGRSDDTIKISGKRTGPAEIEAILIATHRVIEAAAVGVPDPVKGSAVICVVVPATGEAPDEALAAALALAVATEFGSSFRPQRVIFVSDLPKTRNMKVLRRVIRSVLTHEAAGDLSALVNPEAVEELQRCSIT